MVNKLQKEVISVSDCKVPNMRRGYVGDDVPEFVEGSDEQLIEKELLLKRPAAITAAAAPTSSDGLAGSGVPSGSSANHPPNMKGDIWRLRSNNIWSKKYHLLLNGQLNEDTNQLSLEGYSMHMFRLDGLNQSTSDANAKPESSYTNVIADFNFVLR